MSDIKISVCASANRPVLQNGFKNWERFLNSLRGNKINYEVIFAGEKEPNFDVSKYPEFKWIKATVKPTQCYQLCYWEAKGELIHWCADDCSYNDFIPNVLDKGYERWKEAEKRHGNDGKTIIALNPCEDGGFPQAKFHRFWGGWEETPVMAPLGLVPRHYLCDEGQGGDKYFVSGQSENDICMRVLEDGGRVEMALDIKLYIHHRQVHPRDNTGKERNYFRKWYPKDRERLENCWVKGGYGFYEKMNAHKSNRDARKEVVSRLSKTRLCPVEPFEKTADVCSVTQGEKGQW